MLCSGKIERMDETNTSNAPAAAPLSPEAADIAENKDLAALSYVWILALVVHFTKAQSPFVQFHSRQGLVLFALSLVFALVPMVNTLLLLLILALSVLGFLNAAQGLKKDLPLIGAIARADLPGLKKSWSDLLEMFRHLFARMKRHASTPAASVPAPAQPVLSAATPASASASVPNTFASPAPIPSPDPHSIPPSSSTPSL